MRMSDEQYRILQAMALLTGKSMAEFVREAITEKAHQGAAEAHSIECEIDEDARRRKIALRIIKDSASD